MDFFVSAVKPNVAVEMSSVVVAEDVDVTLRCIIDANPPAHSLHWLHNGNIVKSVTNPSRNESKMFELLVNKVTR